MSFKEIDLQNIIEQDLYGFLKVNFLSSEYVVNNYKIDTIGIDDYGTPVIIEYKLSKNYNIITQLLTYKKFLLQNKTSFELLVKQNGYQGYINWENIILIGIAECFNQYDIHSLDMLDSKIILYSYIRNNNYIELIDPNVINENRRININGKLDLLEYINGTEIILSSKKLCDKYGYSERSAQLKMANLVESGLFIKISNSKYVYHETYNKLSTEYITTIIDNTSYIGIYSIYKNLSKYTYVISNNKNTYNELIMDDRKIVNITIKVNCNFGLVKINNILYSDIERSLLDLIYLNVYTGFEIHNKLPILNDINIDKIQEYLVNYPDRVYSAYKEKLSMYIY